MSVTQEHPEMSVTNKSTTTQLDTVKESLKDVLASVVGSAACVYSGQPFDTVKVRMQVQPGEFKNSLECFRKTMVGEGIPTLWRGSVPAFMGALSENAMAFCINGNLKRLLEGCYIPTLIFNLIFTCWYTGLDTF